MMTKNNEFVALSPGNLLWERISGFRLDDPTARLPFSKKLAREQKWDETFTRRAIEEYKRFIYLCCISPTGASPSEVVDRVWHQHLLYTENYWDAFCGDTLGKKIHHYPSSGGAAERKKFAGWQEETGRLYRLCFGEDPPPAFWKNKMSPYQRLIAFPRRWLTTLLLFSVILFTGCSGNSSYSFMLILFAVIFLTAWNNNNNAKDKNPNSGDSSGSSCSSSCSSSCGSGCGGGCGGCGGS